MSGVAVPERAGLRADVFLSYHRGDRPVAESLARHLERQGLSVWWDREIPAGKTFDRLIEQAVGSARCVLVLWSASSVRSRWVRAEAEEGARRHILVPVLIQETEIPLAFRQIQAADLVDWDGTGGHPACRQLVRDVSRVLRASRKRQQEALNPGDTPSEQEAPSKPEPLGVDSRLSHFRIIEKLGEGGMGVVYRAEDIHLGREVAIKVLPQEFVSDRERLARLEHEAKILASLNHPHIATLHQFEASDGHRFLVMELVEGETLAECIKRRPLPPKRATAIAIEIAEALEAAHQRGIVHRDLKPANVKLTSDGQAKVLDFGIAKAMEIEPSDPDFTSSPTLAEEMGRLGEVTGTAAYMSPEQARGEVVDERTDIWSFGCVIYEMLTGRAAFGGKTVADCIARTLGGEPDWEALPEGLPVGLRHVVRLCLAKDLRQRLHHVGDVRIELEEALEEPEVGEVAALAPHWWQRGLPWLVMPLALIAVWLLKPVPQPEPVPTVRFGIDLPEGERLAHCFRQGLDISSDGRMIAFVSGTLAKDGFGFPDRMEIRLRRLDRAASAPIRGTEGGAQPTFSPDGEWIAFVTLTPEGQKLLRKVPVHGGEPVTICECDADLGVSWALDGSIVFGSSSSGLQRVSAHGGEPEALTALDPAASEISHRLPHVLSGGKAVLFTVLRHSVVRLDHEQMVQTRIYSFDSGEQKPLIDGGADARYLPTGHLVFARQGRLMAVPFDAERLEITGPEMPVLEGVHQSVDMGWGSLYNTLATQVAISSAGTLAYVASNGFPEVPNELLLIDRSGRAERLPAEPKSYYLTRVVAGRDRIVSGTIAPPWDLWSVAFDRGVVRRQTFEGSVGHFVPGPDPGQVTFVTIRDGSPRISWTSLDSGPVEVTTLETQVLGMPMPSSWSPDGSRLAVVTGERSLGRNTNIWIVHRDGTSEPFLNTETYPNLYLGYPEFSPDGQWIAYVSGESSRLDVYLRPYPGPGPATQISTDGGTAPAWSRDGREIIFRSGENRDFYAVKLTISGGRVAAGNPVRLFDGGDYAFAGPVRAYDVLPDGRLLVTSGGSEGSDAEMAALEEFHPTRIQVVQNWTAELEEKFHRNSD